MTPWSEQDIPDLSGKTAVVTGANSGLGYETARALAGKGAHVVMACRDTNRAASAVIGIRRGQPGASVEAMALDLADLSSVRRFATALLAVTPRLDILCNNAGIMAIPYRRTVDGFEMQFGTNHLGHFALTGLLLPAILSAPAPRVVTVSSGVHVSGRLDFDKLHAEEGYSRWAAYSRSKLANLLSAYELQRKFEIAGCSAISVAAHPGYAATNLQFAGPRLDNSALRQTVMRLSNRLLAQTAAMGALPELYAATAPGVRGGEYIGPSGLLGMRGHPQTVRSSALSYDRALAARLWAVSEKLTGVRFAFPPRLPA
jgi:NAD(P)-dependent dehydrogenase (short-subunit alcohol dehydrogenase family)